MYMVGAVAGVFKAPARYFNEIGGESCDELAAYCLLIGARCWAIVLAFADHIPVCTDHVHYLFLIPQ